MKRAMILTVIAGALALSTALPFPASGAELLAVAPPAPEDTDSTACTLRDGPRVAASGCCQRQGGVCGCRGGKAKCCDGTPGTGCSCRGDSTTPEEL